MKKLKGLLMLLTVWDGVLQESKSEFGWQLQMIKHGKMVVAFHMHNGLG